MRQGWVIGGGLLVALGLLLAAAWRDAGVEPQRLIAEPVILPGQVLNP
jgi:hypothetical protein